MHATEQFNVVGILLALGVIVILGLFVDLDALKDSVLAAGIWAPLAFIALKTLTVVMVPLSGAPLYPIVGAFFGFFPGVFYVIIGDAIGYTIAFFLSRTLGLPIVSKWIATDEQSIFKRAVDHVGTIKGFLHTCLTLGAVPELIAYAAGLTKLPYRIFIPVMIMLSAAVSSILVYIGATFGTEGTLATTIILPLAALVIIAIGGTLFMRAIAKEKKEAES
jgi:uncharacterized membrane protein YdjX (TVP38/TMEM64 family)